MITISDLMYRANYCVFPGSAIAQMPQLWQNGFTSLLIEMSLAFPSWSSDDYSPSPIVGDAYDEEPELGDADVAGYVTLPVCLMLSMPDTWQATFVELAEQFNNAMSSASQMSYQIDCCDRRFDYRHDRFEPFTEEKLLGVGGRLTNEAIAKQLAARSLE